ncbi:hypothetical protein BB050_03356 [Flavobacterium anhuiense]|uniref:Uncharacterized protein n=1 Tax=Flavobacterium anhuiense TaxID=459526 RepID=A0AAC9GJA4_9FLAO|nr:hypothetical protein [Flavobacterium anhuiense]AOC96445.1 hypothetical protein BB050_03356 [Flavobacterium anhuiense]
MRKIYFLFFAFCISCTNKTDNQIIDNSFSLKEVNVAMIYSKKLDNLRCLLYNVTDTIKEHKKLGVVFTFDIKINHIAKFSNSSGCGCAIEPGLGGSADKIKSLKILLKNDKNEIDITNMLVNSEESVLYNSFENFDKRRFDKNDFSCVCLDKKSNQYVEYLNKNYLGGKVYRKVHSKRVPILKNPKDFISWFNNFNNDKFQVGFSSKNITSGRGFLHTNFPFWLPDHFFKILKNYNVIKIEVELENGLFLEKTRELKMI